jgi:outer membrane protein assembly factor BamB
MTAEVGGMKIIKLIIIAVILTILVFPAGIFIENWHPLNDLSWPMQFPNTQLNMVSNFSGPTNFKNIPVYNAYSYMHNLIYVVPHIYFGYVIYKNTFINFGIQYNSSLFYNTTYKYTYLNNTIVVASNTNKMLWNFTQIHQSLFSFNQLSVGHWNLLSMYEPLVYRNTVFFTGTDGYLYALSLKGDLLWEKYLAPVYFTYIFPDNDYLYLFGLNFLKSNNTYYVTGESIYKLNLNNNEIEWNTTINTMVDLVNPKININLLPTLWNNTIYIPLGSKIYYLNGSNGKIGVLGIYDSNFTNYLTYSGNALYGTFGDRVVKISIKDGGIIWKFNVTGPNPCTIFNRLVVFATHNGYTYALNSDTGKEIWNTFTNLGVAGPVTITSNQIIYEIGSINWYIIQEYIGITALDLISGKIIDNIFYISYGLGPGEFKESLHLMGGKPEPLMFNMVIVPNNDVVIDECLIGGNAFVGYISHYYIWMTSILIIWVSITIFIILKIHFRKK